MYSEVQFWGTFHLKITFTLHLCDNFSDWLQTQRGLHHQSDSDEMLDNWSCNQLCLLTNRQFNIWSISWLLEENIKLQRIHKLNICHQRSGVLRHNKLHLQVSDITETENTRHGSQNVPRETPFHCKKPFLQCVCQFEGSVGSCFAPSGSRRSDLRSLFLSARWF